MNHLDHVNLLEKGIKKKTGIWADLGSGTGAFTFALSDLLDPEAVIYSIDKEQHRLDKQKKLFRQKFGDFPAPELIFRCADITAELGFTNLDGLVLANVLHFFVEKEKFLEKLVNYLSPGGHFILVEYNVDSGNMWVPFPISFKSWEKLAPSLGLTQTRRIGLKPSSFLREIYASLSIKSW